MPDQPFNLNQNIIAMLGLETLPEAERRGLLSQATELIQKRIALRLMEQLNEQDAETVNQLQDDPVRLYQFLSTKVDNLPGLIEQEVNAVKLELVQTAKSADREIE